MDDFERRGFAILPDIVTSDRVAELIHGIEQSNQSGSRLPPSSIPTVHEIVFQVSCSYLYIHPIPPKTARNRLLPIKLLMDNDVAV
jgi:hypothetical protein